MGPSSIPPYMIHVQNVNALPPDVFAKSYLPPESSLVSYASTKVAAHASTAAHPTDSPDSKLDYFDIELKSSLQINKSALKACFDLVVETSAGDYRRSSRGWKPRAKWKEMGEPDMRYLLVHAHKSNGLDEAPNPLLAFLSFMITIEDAQPVLYIYELHTTPTARRKGLGAHLMRVVEHVAALTRMECCMLTVFRSNKGARTFYTGCGYDVDESSPRDKMFRGGKVKKCDYLILSKRIEKKENISSKNGTPKQLGADD